MYYPHRLDVHQLMPVLPDKIGQIRCLVRADTGVRANSNAYFNEGTSAWLVLTPITTLAVLRKAVSSNVKYNFGFALPKNPDGTLLYQPNPFHREIFSRTLALAIVEYAASERQIRMILESNAATPILGDAVIV